jgi:PucR family transcriptional regulator, purine catabolism regulatory protein
LYYNFRMSLVLMPEGGVRDTQITLGEILELPVVRRGLPVLLHGFDDIAREVTWVHVGEFPEPEGFLRGGELVLTTGMGMGTKDASQRRWIRLLAEQHAAALFIELGLIFKQHVPRVIVETCVDHDLPLVALRRQVAFVDVTRAITELALTRRAAVTWHAGEVQAHLTEMVLSGRSTTEVLDALAMEIGAPVAFETTSGELIHCASGPFPAGRALDALDYRRRHPDRYGEDVGAFVAPLPGTARSAGRLVALGIERSPDGFQRVALQHAAGVIALEQRNLQHADQLQFRTRGALLSDLAAGREAEADTSRRASLLGFPHSPRVVMPFVVRRRRAAEIRDQVWQDIAAGIRKVCSARGIPTLVGLSSAEVLGLAAFSTVDEEAAFGRVADAVHAVLGRYALDEGSVVIAFAGIGDGWNGAGDGLRCAIRGAGAAQSAPPQRWHDARQAGVRGLLYDLRDRPELLEFAREQLAGLTPQVDRTRALRETLRVYIEAHGRKAVAARTLHLDRTALYGRLSKIERYLGIDLEDSDTRLALEIAFAVLTTQDDGG